MRKSVDKNKIILYILLASFFTAYAGSFIFQQQYSLLDAQLNDHFFRLRHKIGKKELIDHRIVLVTIGDSTYRKRKLPLWDRRIFGQLIKILTEAQVASIAFDIVFQDKSYRENDSSLIEAYKEAGNILSPVILNPVAKKEKGTAYNQTDPGSAIPGLLIHPHIPLNGDPIKAGGDIFPFRELLEYSHSLGHINCDADNDGINRRYPLLIRSGADLNAYYPSLAFRMVYEHFGVDPDNIAIYFGKKIVLKDARFSGNAKGNIEIPVDNQGRMIINWAGPWYEKTFPNYSPDQLLAAMNNPVELMRLRKILEGALVVIADVSTPYNDQGPGVFEKVYPLSGIHLNVANALLTRNFMRFPGIFSRYILPVIILLLMFFLSTRLKLFPLLVSCLGIYMIFWLVNFTLFLLFSRLASLVAPSIGFLLAGVFIFAYRFVIEERERITLQAAKEKERFQKEFIQDIAHELKTPLTLVLGPLETLLRNPHNNVEEKINFISRNAQKLLYLINQFLQLSKLETSEIKMTYRPVELIQWLHSKLLNFGYLLNKKTIKSNFYPPDKNELFVYADINKLDMIFNNIFMNIYKYAGEQSRVDVTVSDPAPLSGELKEHDWPYGIPEKMIVVKITDTGIGIPQEEILRIFEQKTQARYSGSGIHSSTGIGLYIVKKYIELHYGSIEAQSEPGKGTEFIITLPLGSSHIEKSQITEESLTGKSLDDDKNLDEILNIYASELEKNLSGKKEKQVSRKKREGSNGTVLIADDEPDMRLFIREVLEEYYEIVEAVNGKDGYEKAQKIKPDLILTDIRMPELDGIRLLKKIKQDRKLEHIPVIFITVNELADLDFDREIQGPDEYLVKPFSPGILLSRVKSILELKNHKKELEDIEKSLSLKNPGVFSNIITNNMQMKMLFKQIEEIAPLSQPILITGETGTGKELIAEAVHEASGLKEAYISTNIAAHEKGLLSSALFGYKKGAFTGADKDNEGFIKAAEGGTLFLDEIGDMDYEAQVKLLRALDPGDYEMVGSTQKLKCKARIIAASNRDLQRLINEDKFKHDLLNRFIYKIHIPPLRERRGDIPLLLNHFFQLAAKESGKPFPRDGFGELIKLLRDYSFPNNIRDIKNMAYLAVSSIDYKGKLPLSVFQNYIREYPGSTDKQEIIHPGSAKTITFSGGFFTLDEVEAIYIRAVLKKTNQDVGKAAEILGRDKSVIYKKLKRFVSV